MSRKLGSPLFSIAVPALLIAFPIAAVSQTPVGSPRARRLITGKVDESRLARLAGNTRSQANAQNDLGAVPGSLVLEHMLLQLQRSAGQEQAVEQYIDELHDPQSPNFHKWLTAEQFGQTYGPAQADIATVTSWLQSHGFSVNLVYPSGMVIDFSGTAAQIKEAFRTEIHYLNVNGKQHMANMSDPMIPAALAPAIAGIVSLHDFRPKPMKREHANFTFGYQGSSVQALVPGDLATIYNFNPLFNAGYTGKGQTIAVLEDSDMYQTSDYTTFQTTFGLNNYGGTLVTVNPQPANGFSNCVDPGVAEGDDGEATSDAEWASAAAPGATIMVASCADTYTTFGGLIAMQNLLNGSTAPPSVMSISYGECEAENGASANAAFNSMFQQAVAQGVSVFVSAGDEGAASCDSGASSATHGIGVSAWASTPYNVAVGGTDFADGYAGTTSTYWNSTNSSNYSSAVSYIPEIPWNDSCASTLLATAFGFFQTFGSGGFCNSNEAQQNQLQEVAAGSGGPSGCATGAPSQYGVVSGTCQGYAKPSWQTGVTGIPNDGVRDIPDLSLFTGDGVWGHYYVTCFSDRRNGGSSCAGDPSTWAGAGGTSFSAPIMAGLQAIINQKMGSAQGNPNYVYYKIAAKGYGSSLSGCNSSSAASSCIFYDVTQGDIDVNCTGTQSCYGSETSNSGGTGFPGFPGRRGGGGFGFFGASMGALSTSASSLSLAFGTGTGWDLATGIGTVNAYNLVMNW
jgi:subtilase family serine protease